MSGVINFMPYLLFSFSKGDAAAIETELLRDYKFGQQQLIELWGQACALAISKVWIEKVLLLIHKSAFLLLFTFILLKEACE